jgi:hypothetical protein
MKAAKNGYFVHLLQSDGQPYQIWSGDLWRCESCGNEVVSGYGGAPVAQHLGGDVEDRFERFRGEVDLEVP